MNEAGVMPGYLERGPLQGDSFGMHMVPVRNYDVFINHRGPDVKKKFVSHLSAALLKLNLRPFVDNLEIQPGDLAMPTIKSAIEQSKVHIAVFSPGYADSSWCLDELQFFMEHFHTKSTDHLFLPVFFEVTPSDLRLLTPSRESCYNSAFEKYGSRYEAATINNWKKALHDASGVKGYIFPDDFQGFEARLVDSIVSKVLEVLSRATLLHGPEHPVGLDEKLRAALDLIERKKRGKRVQKLGIYGMGGLGKTTLAKSIYNRIHREFESACFMQSVSEGKGLAGLQTDMLLELTQFSLITVCNMAHGQRLMRDHLEGKKVLIILDDVREEEQLRQLMPPYDCHLGQDSLIVITTRDLQVLYWARADTYLPMEGLSRALACELFNLHASHSIEDLQEEPSGDRKKLAERVADACQGLPLALEVLGSYLRGKDISEWKATVKMLEDENKMVNPQKPVTAILRISFDALRFSEEKQMFLDMACLLLKEPKDKAMRIWRSDYGDAAAEHYLQNLIRKCLVKVNKNGELTMHGLLRKMGQEVVEHSHKDYWERSHLWRKEDVKRVLIKGKGTSHVRGLISNVQKEWDTTSFASMDELKLLVLSEVTLTGDFSKVSQELIWIQLRDCPLEIPLSLNFDNVAVLDLEGSKFTSLNCMPQNLKELNLSNCSNLEELSIDFRKSSNSLEILILRGCAKLTTLPDGWECLCLLSYLDISKCRRLKDLPSGQLEKLRSLKCLKLTRSGVAVVQDIGSPWIQKMVSLEELSMWGICVPDYFKESSQEEHCLVVREDWCAMEMVVPEGDIACKGVLCCFVVTHESMSIDGVTAEVVGKGEEGQKFSQVLVQGSNKGERYHSPLEELRIFIFSASHPLVASLKGGDTIRFSAPKFIFAGGAVKLMYEVEETLQKLSLMNYDWRAEAQMGAGVIRTPDGLRKKGGAVIRMSYGSYQVGILEQVFGGNPWLPWFCS